MARNTRRYGWDTVNRYIRECDTITGIDTIEGCLIDTYILYHECGVIEVFEETYLNEWSSAYVRHIYRKGLPRRFRDALEREEREAQETAYYEALQSGIFDLMSECI